MNFWISNQLIIRKKQNWKKCKKRRFYSWLWIFERKFIFFDWKRTKKHVNGILEVAQGSDHPRAYEVAGQLIKSVGDTTDKLIDLQSKMKELNKEDRSLIIEAINELVEILSDWEDNEEYIKELNDLLKRLWEE